MSNNAPDYENNLAFDPDINTMPRCDIEALKSEIKHLKELLKKCSPYVARSATSRMIKNSVGHKKDMNLLTKIDNAIGENN